VTGRFLGTVQFDDGTQIDSVGIGFNVFVARYDSDGTLAWVDTVGTAGTVAEGRAVVACTDGSCIVTGSFGPTTTMFGDIPLTAEGQGTFLAKWDEDGSVVWAKEAGGRLGSAGRALARLPDGTIVLAGEFIGSATFGRGESKQTVLDAVTGDSRTTTLYVARFSQSDGSLVWARLEDVRCNYVFGERTFDSGLGVAALSDSSIVVAGYYQGTATFSDGTELADAGGGDSFVARFEPVDGALLWVAGSGAGTGVDEARAVAVLEDNTIAVTGRFDGTAGFPGGSKLVGDGIDVFVARYTDKGQPVDVRHGTGADGNSGDRAHAAAALPDRSAVIVVGEFDGQLSFGTATLTATSGAPDVFIAEHAYP
jgi:hypothetical protein